MGNPLVGVTYYELFICACYMPHMTDNLYARMELQNFKFLCFVFVPYCADNTVVISINCYYRNAMFILVEESL